MGNVIRGKNVMVNGEGTVDYFELHTRNDLDMTVAGNTDGGEMVISGNDDWWGHYRLRPSAGYPVRFPNDSFALLAGPETGARGVSGTARCTAIEMTWDIRNGRAIDAEVHFGANGTLTSNAVISADANNPNPLTSKEMYCSFAGASYDTLHVDFMRLRISAEQLIEYVDGTSDGQTLRTEGDMSAIAQWKMSCDAHAEFPSPGSFGNLQMRVTATTYWDINWMRIMTVRWLTDRRQKQLPVQGLVTARFSGNNGTEVGFIKQPGDTTKWP